MPVITRSQSVNAKNQSVKPRNQSIVSDSDRLLETRSEFAKTVGSFPNSDDVKGHQVRTEYLINIFKYVNKHFISMYNPDELRFRNPAGFNKLISTMYSRAVYLSNDIHDYNDIKKNTKKAFLETINKTIVMLKPYFDQTTKSTYSTYSTYSTNGCRRSKRNIPRVNYADLLNRDEEYDYADESEDDEDYVYEEELDIEDDDDEYADENEDDDEDVREAAEALVQMKNKHTTSQPLRRSKRKVARVNYAEYSDEE